MTTTINNEWITLAEQRNGVDIQRAFAGIYPMVSEPENGVSIVKQCIVYYWERELYPNGKPIKTSLRNYVLEDLAETINDIEGWKMEELLVLSGFVQNLGYPGIINPARETLAGEIALSVGAPDGYELHKETRPKINL